jgi:hypothetical protein
VQTEVIQDRRAFFRQGLNDLYLPLYDHLCETLPPPWQPYAGYRTFKAQDDYFHLGRDQNAAGEWVVVNKRVIVTDARGGESGHCYGCATDWTIFDGHKALWPKKDDPRWKEYLDALAKIPRLRSGHEFSWDDVDHNELKIAISWKDVHAQYLAGGMGAANAAIYAAILTG